MKKVSLLSGKHLLLAVALITFAAFSMNALPKAKLAAAPLPAGTYCGDTPPADGSYTGPTKFLIIVGENEPYHEALDPTDGPFEANTLNTQCGYMSNMHNETHGSESNYHALVSGQYANWARCDFPPDDNGAHACAEGPVGDYGNTPSLMSQLESAGGPSSWKIYAESMQKNCQPYDGPNGGPYAVRHNPGPYFPNISCATQDIPMQPQFGNDLTNGLPQFSMIIPDDNDNGHDTDITDYDSFLSTTMSQIQSSPDYQSGKLAVIVTYDEGTSHGTDHATNGEDCTNPNQGDTMGSCQIDSWVVGRYVPHVTWNQFATHYTMLKSLESAYGFSYLGHAADPGTVDFYNDTNPFDLNQGAVTQPTAPPAPNNVTATPGNGQAIVSFSPNGTGGSSITGYTVTSSPGNVVASGSASPITVTGLTNGTPYTFTVTATNAIGTGPPSAASNSVTPTSYTNLLTNGDFENGLTGVKTYSSTSKLNLDTTTVHGGNNAVQVTNNSSPTAGFNAPVITGNKITAAMQLTGSCWVNAPAANYAARLRLSEGTSSYSSLGESVSAKLTPGVWTQVSFAANAQNTGDNIILSGYTNNQVVGSSSGLVWDDCSVLTPNQSTLTAPDPPTAVNAIAGDGQAIVSFTPPANNGGSAITSYSVTSYPGGVVASGSSSPITVTGLTDGTSYTFTVTATNSIGTGAASVASNSVTPTAPVVNPPDAPTGVTASAGNAQATISFTPPANNGGATITGYTVTASPGGMTASGTSSPITMTGLTNNTAYSFTVTATNAAGTGAASAASNTVTPTAPVINPPSAPTNVTATAGNGQATVSFTPPSVNGGAPVTSYTVTAAPGGVTATGTGSPITVTGLTNGTPYTFTVTATNSAGTSPASSVSNPVTPTSVRSLLTNGDFENGLTGIRSYSSTSILALNTTTVHGGTNALQVTNKTAATAGFNAPTIAASQLTAGMALTGTCWVYSPAANYQAHVRLSEGTSSYTSLADTTSAKLTPGVWTQLSVTATTQKTGDSIVFSGYTNNQVIGSSTGLIWDDCAVTTPN